MVEAVEPQPKTLPGPDGNERLTAATGVALLVLLVIEVATLVSLQAFLPEHIFVGLLLVPPVALKLCSTGWRFFRYYTRSEAYLEKGPPKLLLRALAPFLILTTITLFASGVGMIVVGPRGNWRWLLGLHKVSFALWLILTAVHVLAYAFRAWRQAGADWRRERRASGASTRRRLIVGTLAAGLVIACAAIPVAQTWQHWMQTHQYWQHDDR